MKSINPATEEIVGEIKESSQQDVLNAVSKARKAFQTWKNTKYEERAEAVSNFGKILKKRQNEIAELATKEMGKPILQSKGDVDRAISMNKWFIDNTEKFIMPEKLLDKDDVEGVVYFPPIGVIGILSPWNFPITNPCWKIIPALLTGNTVVSKFSEYVCLMGVKFEEMFLEAGLPEGVFNAISGNSDIGKELVDSPVNMICLTGSTATGKYVAEKAGKDLKKVNLELGGSDAFIVFEDADIESTAKAAVAKRFGNCGQICVAAKRFFIQDSIYDEFKEKFLEKMKEYKIGNPLEESTTLGPLVSEKQRELLEKQVKKAISQGAKLTAGGRRTSVNGKGYFFEPTLLENAYNTTAMSEELFGPVAAFDSFKTAEEAIKKANDSVYGLGGSIWTKNIKKAKELAAKFETGMVGINQHAPAYPELPWVGIKNSGLGCELSKYGILEMVHKKPVVYPK